MMEPAQRVSGKWNAMRSYILKRLLIMIPTFFGISVIVFIIINMAPGRPGTLRQTGDVGAYMRGEQTQESVRIFREQFDLDKPVLFNARFAITNEEILALLQKIPSNSKVANMERIHAYERLQDDGYYIIPQLIHAMRTARDITLRDTAVYFLRTNSQRMIPYPKAETAAQQEANHTVSIENAMLSNWRYQPESPEETKQQIIAKWNAWYDEHQGRWQYTTAGKLRMFFGETRFAKYWRNLLHLDFGVSLVTRQPVMQTMVSKLKYSISLSIISLLLAYLISIPLGIFSAVRKDTATDRVVTSSLFMLYSLPSYFVGTLLLYFLSKGSDYPRLRWFPTGGWSSPDSMQLTSLGQIKDIGWHLMLPILCLTYGSLAGLSRYMRAGLLDVIRSDYIRTARAKGLSERVVIFKHALRNGLLPILTLLAGLLPAVLGGSVIIETIFGIPGMGLWLIDSIYQRDYNVIMAEALVSALLTLVGILISDLSYALVDPRISYK